MWTKREKAMLRAMGKIYLANIKKMREALTGHVKDIRENKRKSLAACIIQSVYAARKVNEPDYRAMWEELRGIHTGKSFKIWMADIERRHGGKA